LPHGRCLAKDGRHRVVGDPAHGRAQPATRSGRRRRRRAPPS
jgi:hypothetical protein